MGHPIEVMDLSFAIQALSAQHIAKNGAKMKAGVYDVPNEIDVQVARLKLGSLGISIDVLTESQQKYLCSWDIGT
jgi:adenosylhomocysteinase